MTQQKAISIATANMNVAFKYDYWTLRNMSSWDNTVFCRKQHTGIGAKVKDDTLYSKATLHFLKLFLKQTQK